jgi:hypothetical protein
MRTNLPNNITTKVPIFNSIKQGCPLAPLLFILIMDELHCTYRKTGGYALDPTTVVSSRGYCDDTAILSDNLETLRTMNYQTVEFFNKHNLHINVTKTKITGIHADDSALTPDNHTRIT